MATNITAGNATNGVSISSDSTGTLDIKTGTGAGAVAVSIDASQNITMPGNLTVTGIFTAGGGTVYNLNSYFAPTVWTKPTGLKAIKVTVVGAGGTGGSATLPNNASTLAVAGGGGGGGGASIQFLPAPSIPGPVAVTAGPGTNSFGAFASATAGSTGGTGTFAAPVPIAAGGAGGLGSGGIVNIRGGSGSTGIGSVPSAVGGSGGASILGGGGVTSAAGGDYGGGGGGGIRVGPSIPGTTPGAAGAFGVVIVEEFY
jgi:hypothetical protein